MSTGHRVYGDRSSVKSLGSGPGRRCCPAWKVVTVSSLRVMTFNVQLMTRMLSKGKFDLGELVSDPFKDKLIRLMAALGSQPIPDVLVLNEVFSEEARGRLVVSLAPYFPHMVPAFGPTGTTGLIVDHGKLDDSGLMLCSRWPVQVQSFTEFQDCAGADKVAMKGFGVVLVDGPLGPVVLVLTHLQADDEQPIRHRQLDTIRTALMTPPLQALVVEHPVLLCGDLNVDGVLPRPEWEDLFQTTPPVGLMGDLFKDCWDEYMPKQDSGLTTMPKQEDGGPTPGQRLDYVLSGGMAQHPLVAQHMRIRHRGVSDHSALWVDLNFDTANCTPVKPKKVTPAAQQWSGCEAMEFVLSGSMQWARFAKPGTYIFTSTAGHDLRVYSETNISDPIPDFDRTSVDLRRVPGSEVAWQELNLPPEGRKFHLPNAPFLVRLSNPSDTPGHTGLGWVQCRGRSPFDAIVLGSHAVPEDYEWVAGAAVDEEAWFQAFICRSVDGRLHTSVFHVDNPSRSEVRLRVRDLDEAILSASDWTDAAHVDLAFEDDGGRCVYFTVERRSLTTQRVQVGWRTGLTILTGAREPNEDGTTTHKLGLECVDETSVDWWGDDETVLTLFVQHNEVAKYPADRDHWDADSEETAWFEMQPIPFLTGIEFEVRELDEDRDDVGRALIDPLGSRDPGDDPNLKDTARSIPVQVGTGTYALRFSLARNPVGGSPNGKP